MLDFCHRRRRLAESETALGDVGQVTSGSVGSLTCSTWIYQTNAKGLSACATQLCASIRSSTFWPMLDRLRVRLPTTQMPLVLPPPSSSVVLQNIHCRAARNLTELAQTANPARLAPGRRQLPNDLTDIRKVLMAAILTDSACSTWGARPRNWKARINFPLPAHYAKSG